MFWRFRRGSARYALVPGAHVDGGPFRHAADRADRSDVLLVKLPITPPTTGQQKRTLRNRAARMAGSTRVRHPGAANFSRAFVEGTSLYVVCPAPAGVPLRRLLADGLLDVPSAVQLGHDLLEILDVAHASGQVHGWIEPDMVWVTPAGRAHIVGFGVRELALGLRAGDPGGAGCRAPETLAGAAPDPASDLYSVGAVLFHSLYGGPPDARTYQLPGPFGEAVRQMLAREPSARPGPDWIRDALDSHVDPAGALLDTPHGPIWVPPPSAPVSGAPTSGSPWSEPPVSGPAMSAAPISGAPTSGSPWSEPLVSGPTTTAAPMSGPPMSGPPMSAPPMSAPPISGPTSSRPPLSGPATSGRPVSGPATSGRPMSEAPMFEAPTVWLPSSGAPTSEFPRPTDPAAWRPPPRGATTSSPYPGPTTMPLPPHVLPPSTLPRMSAVPQRSGNVRRRTLIGGGIAAVVAAGAGVVWATRRPGHPAAAPEPGPGPTTSPSGSPVPAGPPGTALWSTAVPPNLVRRPRVIDGVAVVEGTDTVALRVTDGSVAWQLLGSAHHVTVADDLLYVQQGTDGQRTLSAVRPSDGTVRSTANIADAILALTVVGPTGYLLGAPHEAATSATLLRAIDVHSGAPKWTFPKALGLSNYPIVDDDRVYVAGSGVIWAIDRATGAVRWQCALPRETRPSVRGLAAGLVIVRGGGGTYALDPATGAIRWKLIADDNPYLGSQAGVDGDTLYTGSLAAPGYLRAVNASDGTERWKVAASSPASHAMVSGGVVYATGGDTVDARSAADGRPMWSYALHDTCTVEPVAGDGLVFAATAGGHLHAIHTG